MPVWAERAGKAKIAELWRSGVNMKRIAELLGAPSRSAVAGYIHREGLERPEGAPQSAPAAKKPNPPQVRPRRAAVVAAAPETSRRPHGPLTILQLSDLTCRYPLGPVREPATLFCGEQAVPGAPYCAAHCDICFSHAAARRAA